MIGAFPGLVDALPKPGAWMETFKQLMGFVLLGTVVYLFSTINSDYFIPTLALVMGVWLACWIIGRVPIYEDTSKQVWAWVGGLRGSGARRLFVVHVPGAGEAPVRVEAVHARQDRGTAVRRQDGHGRFHGRLVPDLPSRISGSRSTRTA